MSHAGSRRDLIEALLPLSSKFLMERGPDLRGSKRIKGSREPEEDHDLNYRSGTVEANRSLDRAFVVIG